MAIGMLLEIPDGTLETYHEVNRRAFGREEGPETPPEGLIIHTAGVTKAGFRIFDVWESREHFERFMQEYIAPAMEGLEGPQPEPEIYDLANIVSPAVATTT